MYFRRTVTNKMTGQNVLLTKEDTKMIQQIYGKKHPTAAGEDLYAVCSVFVVTVDSEMFART